MNFSKEKLLQMQTGPSIASSIYLGGGILSAEILFSITQRRRLFSAPYYSQIDLLTGEYVRKKLHFGNRGPLQKLKLWLAQREYGPECEAFKKFIR